MRRPALLVVALVLLPVGSAEADRSLPAHYAYHADRSLVAASRAWSAGIFERAENLAEDAVRLDRTSVAGWSLLVESRLALGRVPGAVEAARSLADAAPEDAGAALLRSRAHVEAGDRAAALEALSLAAAEAPADARVEMARALVAARLSADWPSMKDHLRRARALDPALPDATLPLQAAWAPLADNQAFLAAFTEVLQEAP